MMAYVDVERKVQSGSLGSQTRQTNWSQALLWDMRVPSTSSTAVKIANKDAHRSMMLWLTTRMLIFYERIKNSVIRDTTGIGGDFVNREGTYQVGIASVSPLV